MKKLFFLIIVFAFVSCQSNSKKTEPNVVEIVETTVNISGLHCDMCVASVEKGVSELAGIASVVVSLTDSTAIVKFDPSKTDLAMIEKTIVKRGYSIKETSSN
jgi:copper chaperone